MTKRALRNMSAAKRSKNAAHSASRGASGAVQPAPQRRKKFPRLSTNELRLIPIPVSDEIRPGDSLVDKLLASLRRRDLQPGDILVIKHKIVSKSEGRLIDLATIEPSTESIAWAKHYALDPRVIELARRESRSVTA